MENLTEYEIIISAHFCTNLKGKNHTNHNIFLQQKGENIRRLTTIAQSSIHNDARDTSITKVMELKQEKSNH